MYVLLKLAMTKSANLWSRMLGLSPVIVNCSSHAKIVIDCQTNNGKVVYRQTLNGVLAE